MLANLLSFSDVSTTQLMKLCSYRDIDSSSSSLKFNNKNYTVTVLGEPQMGKRGLYPTLSTKKSGEEVRLMMDFISLCDGKTSLLNIADKLNVPIWDFYDLCDKLERHELLE